MPPKSQKRLFSDVVFFISPTIEFTKYVSLKNSLEEHGAKSAVESKNVTEASLMEAAMTLPENPRGLTHVICNDLNSVPDATFYVTPKWVETSVKFHERQAENYYSADPKRLCSSMIVTVSHNIPSLDRNRLFAFVLEYGGQVRPDLTQDVTHVVSLTREGAKYEFWSQHGQALGMRCILPHYFDDVMKIRRRLPEDLYLWPNPPIMEIDPLEHVTNLSKTSDLRSIPDHPPKYRSLQGLTIFLESGLELSQKEVIRLGELGAELVLQRNEEVNCVIAKARNKNYVKAVHDGIPTGSLQWLKAMIYQERWLDPESRTIFCPPPLPSQISQDIKNLKITATNYTGVARDALRHMIVGLGAEYVPHLSANCSVLICAYPIGQKYTKGYDWDVPTVNHLWLQELYLKCKIPSYTRPEFTSYTFNLPDIVDVERYSAKTIVSDANKGHANVITEVLSKSESEEKQNKENTHSSADLKSMIEPLVKEHVKALIELRPATPIAEARTQRKNSVRRVQSYRDDLTATPPQQPNFVDEMIPSDSREDKRKRVSSPPPRQEKRLRRSDDHSLGSTIRTRERSQLYAQRFVFRSTNPISPEERKKVLAMGGKIDEDVDENTTILIASVDSKRTTKLFKAINYGAWICVPEYIKDSIRVGYWLDEKPYLLVGSLLEHEFDFNITQSCEMARIQPFLKNYRIVVTEYASSQPLEEVVKSGGGEYVVLDSKKTVGRTLSTDKNILIVSCLEDNHQWHHFHGYDIWSADLILVGSLRQQIKFLDTYLLRPK